jgi:hypothetical protein
MEKTPLQITPSQKSVLYRLENAPLRKSRVSVPLRTNGHPKKCSITQQPVDSIGRKPLHHKLLAENHSITKIAGLPSAAGLSGDKEVLHHKNRW